MKKIGVRILPRDEVLDTQGRAVHGVLKNGGFAVDEVKVGKYIVLNVPAVSDSEAMAQAKKMAESFLYNPLIEKFELDVLSL